MKKYDDGKSKIVIIFGKGYDERRLRSYLSNGNTELAHKHALIVIASIIKSCIERKEPLPYTATSLEMSVRGSIANIVLALKPYGFKGTMVSLAVHARALQYEMLGDLILEAITYPRL